MNILYVIENFSVFKRSIAISGWMFCPDLVISNILLKFPSNKTYSLGTPELLSPDVATVHGPRATNCRFDSQVLINEPHEDILKSELVICFFNGSKQHIKNINNGLINPTVKVKDDFLNYLKNYKATGRFLEIGSRARSGIVRRDMVPENWTYTGMDIMAGENVDVIGDAHELLKYFPTDKFDAVTAFSVLEHMLMPWKLVVELNRVLNVGGIGFFTTHQAWPIHDAPWDFWRFSDNSWASLFNKRTGFEIISTAMGEPAYTVASFCHSVTDFRNQPSYLSSVVLFRKISDTQLEWPVGVDEIIDNHYPTTTTKL